MHHRLYMAIEVKQNSLLYQLIRTFDVSKPKIRPEFLQDLFFPNYFFQDLKSQFLKCQDSLYWYARCNTKEKRITCFWMLWCTLTCVVSFHPHNNPLKLGEWVSSLGRELQKKQCLNLMLFYKYELRGYICVPILALPRTTHIHFVWVPHLELILLHGNAGSTHYAWLTVGRVLINVWKTWIVLTL